MNNDTRNLVIGFDLGRESSQISYFDRKNLEPVTLSTIVGTSKYQIPTVICKRKGQDIWYYGREAVYFSEQKEGTLITDLLALSEENKEVEIEGVQYQGSWLLGVFIEKSLGVLGSLGGLELVQGIMFTGEEVNEAFISSLGRAMESLGIDRSRYFIQDHLESFYYYILSQKKELWSHEVFLFEYKEDTIYTYTLQINRKYMPKIVSIVDGEVLSFKDLLPENLPEKEYNQKKDELFCQLLEKLFEKKIITSVFLIGDGFDKTWAETSIDYMCTRRKVFLGQNLYTKGACIGAREKLEERNLGDFFYNGPHVLHVNVGMQMTVRGVSSYYSLIEAGNNWYEAFHQCEFILDNTKEIVLQFDTVDRKSSQYTIQLDGLPKRPNLADRILLTVRFTDACTCSVRAEDLGLGELYRASGKVWEASIEI